MSAYQYVVLRYVPRVDREEFVNVGVVLYAQADDFLAAATHVDPARIATLAGVPSTDDALDALRRALETVEAVASGEVRPGLVSSGAAGMSRPGQRFGWLAAPRSTVVQPSPVHGGCCDDPQAVLDDLMRRLVR